MYALTNCRVFCDDEIKADHSVLIDNEHIHSVVRNDELCVSETIDLQGALAVPGFIDIQVNGGGGVFFNDSLTAEAIMKIYEAHRAFGTTSICPTFITDSKEKLVSAIHAASLCDRSMIPAIHIEGIFISRKKSGIHDTRYLHTLDSEYVDILKQGSIKKLVTLAPEETDFSHIEKLLKAGITVFGGHSNANYETFTDFLNRGGIGATHLFNAMSPIESRSPGVCGAVFDHDTAVAGIIADGCHVDYACVRIAKKIMGKRLFLVTDAMPPACSSMNEYSINGKTIRVKDNVCVSDEGVIAGSLLSMAQAVKNCVEHCKIDLKEALRMASFYPAKIISEEKRLGMIRENYHANITVLDDDLSAVHTVVNGVFK